MGVRTLVRPLIFCLRSGFSVPLDRPPGPKPNKPRKMFFSFRDWLSFPLNLSFSSLPWGPDACGGWRCWTSDGGDVWSRYLFYLSLGRSASSVCVAAVSCPPLLRRPAAKEAPWLPVGLAVAPLLGLTRCGVLHSLSPMSRAGWEEERNRETEREKNGHRATSWKKKIRGRKREEGHGIGHRQREWTGT